MTEGQPSASVTADEIRAQNAASQLAVLRPTSHEGGVDDPVGFFGPGSGERFVGTRAVQLSTIAHLIPPMDYDPADLRQLQFLRAVLDPIPVHPRGTHVLDAGLAPADAPPSGALGPKEVVSARLEQVAAQDDPAPIETTPWAEAMLCVRSTFGDARFATSPQWVGVVKYTFREYLASRNLDPDAILPERFFEGPPLPAGVDADSAAPTEATVHDLTDVEDVKWMGITETHREEAEAFRRRLKHVRDRVFVEELYDHLRDVPTVDFDVPKLVWRDAAVDAAADRTEDAGGADSEDEQGAQTGLDMFYR